MASAIETVAGKLKRAAELGRRLRAIRDEPDLWRLSRAAWRSQCLDLAGWSLEQLEAAQRQVETAAPYLAAEIATLARLWADSGQDHPAPAAHVFADGERFGPAYADRLALRLTVDQCSALAAWRTASLRPDASFGRADSLADGERALAPHVAALAELDGELAMVVKIADLSWSSNGRPELRPVDGLVLVVDQSTAGRLASALADAVSRQSRLPVAA